jgi:ABC-2 type transport system permease protein
MFFSITRALAVFKKELIQLKRDVVTLRLIILMPLMQLILFGYALNTDPKHLPTAVLCYDHSSLARAIVQGLKNTQYFSITHTISSDRQGEALLKSGEVLFVVTIPASFERDTLRGEKPAFLIEADGSDPVAVSGALAAAQGCLQAVLAQECTGPMQSLLSEPPPITLLSQHLYNPEGFTRYNIVPGLIAIILTMTGVMMTALAMTREQERGTMENLLAMPISPLEVMSGKIMPYVLIGFFQAILIVFCARTLFGVPIVGNITVLFGALAIFITCNMGLGFTISTLAQNQTQALQMSFMVTLPSIMLSGFLFPFLGMPQWAQILGTLIPAKHFIKISRGVLLKGSDFGDLLPSFLALLCFMIMMTALARRCYRQTLD